jgi:hypothetical protein
MKHAFACRLLTIGFLNLSEFDDQLLRLDFDPDDMGVDETTIVNSVH